MGGWPEGLRVEVWGEAGDALLLVHGSNATDPSATWARQRGLAERYRLYILHRRGYGSSPLVDKRGSFETDVRDVLAVLAQIGPAHLVGFSYGGVLSLLAVVRQPELVRTLTLVEPPAFAVARGHPAVERIVTRMGRAGQWAGADSPEAFIHHFRAAMDIEPHDPGPLTDAQRAGIRGTLAEPPPWLADIPLDAVAATPMPKLVISGAWNAGMDAVADVLTARLAAERAVIPGAGHNVQLTGEPFNEVLTAFVGDTGMGVGIRDSG
jgi:pimeloyl-ACP methyl ester carboxylesterase